MTRTPEQPGPRAAERARLLNRDDLYVVLVTGSRWIKDWAKIRDDLTAAKSRAGLRELVVVDGDCPGADQLGDCEARALGGHVVRVPAQWDHFGTAAGPLRNSIVAALFEFNEILSYPVKGSVGTYDMVRKARKLP